MGDERIPRTEEKRYLQIPSVFYAIEERRTGDVYRCGVEAGEVLAWTCQL
jgi:hypothetical protein